MSITEWTILTSGPTSKFTGTVEEAIAYVEENALLKRGWSRQWVLDDYGAWRCYRFNSKGRRLNSYSVAMVPAKV